MNQSTDYHDYVFRDGKLVGEFEEMYRNSTITPWHQDEQADWIDVRLTKELLKDLGKFDEIHDLGCGTGHYLNIMAQYCLSNNGRSYGYDISKTACINAAQSFPNGKYATLDLTQINFNIELGSRPNDVLSSRLFIIRATLWYVLPKLESVIQKIYGKMIDGDLLLVVQNFPPLETSFVGKDLMPNHLVLIERFSKYFSLYRHLWYQDTSKTINDNWFIGLFYTK